MEDMGLTPAPACGTLAKLERDMKNVKREKRLNKLAAAALLLNLFSPMAFAEPQGLDFPQYAPVAPQKGLSFTELSQAVQNFEPVILNDRLYFTGAIPARCVKTRDPLRPTYKYDAKSGQHEVKVNLPVCSGNDRLARPGEAMVQAEDVFGPIKLDAKSGDIVLTYETGGSALVPANRPKEAILDKEGKPMHYVTLADRESQIAAANARAQEIADAKAELEKIKNLQKDVTEFCKNDKFDELNEVLAANADIFEELVDTYVAKAEDHRKEKAKKALEEAETADAAKEAYEEAVAAGLDAKDMKALYITRRNELLESDVDAAIADGKAKVADAAIRDWVNDLKALDGKEFKKEESRKLFADRYGAIGQSFAKKGDINNAEAYFDKAKKYASFDAALGSDKVIAGMYAAKWQACIKKNPGKMDACDGDLAKMKETAEKIGEAIAQRGGENAEAEVAAVKAEYIQTFGGGATMNYTGLGSFSQVPGKVDQLKVQTYQEAVQQAQMAQQQKMMQQMYGMPAANASSTKGLFGL